MKRGGKALVCLLGGMAVAVTAEAITGDPTTVRHGEAIPRSDAGAGTNVAGNPYDPIIRRNVFDLKDPLDTNVVAVVDTPPPNVKLTGIMNMLGKKQALFMVQKTAQPGRPADAAVSCIMTEGQREGGLEVLDINQKDRKVTIKVDGVVSTITFETPKSEPAALGAMKAFPGRQFPGARPGFNPNMMSPAMNANPGNLPPAAVPPQPPGLPYNPQAAVPNAGVPNYPQDPQAAQPEPQAVANPAANVPGWLRSRTTGTAAPPPIP